MPISITPSHSLVEKNYALISSAISASVYSYLASKSSKTLRQDEIEDVCSESMYKVIAKASTFSAQKASLKTWVSSIAVHTLLDAIDAKKTWNKNFVQSDQNYDPESTSVSEPSYDMVSTVTPEDMMIASETLKKIDEFTADSSDIEKVILEMTQKGFKPKEIAEVLEKSAGSVYVTKCKLLSRLSEALAA